MLSNQVRYSLVDRSPERDLLPFAESTGHIVIAYSPLAQGLLSGKYDRDHRPANRLRAASPLFLPENLDRAGDLIATLREVADAHAATPAQIALAWVIRHPAVVAIPGASSVGQLESNVAAADIDLTEDEYQALHAAAARSPGRPRSPPAPVPPRALGWPGDRNRRHRRAHPDQLRHHHRGRGEPGRVQGGALGAGDMQRHGWRIIPVNPHADQILGEPVTGPSPTSPSRWAWSTCSARPARRRT